MKKLRPALISVTVLAMVALPGIAQPNSAEPSPSRTASLKTFGEEYLEVRQLDRPPEVKSRVSPVYPFAMKKQGITGEVLVEFIVDKSGLVRVAFAVQSTHAEFEAAAIAAVERWEFFPGKKDGKAVNTRMRVPMYFTLSGK